MAADDRTQNANLDVAEGRAAFESGDLPLAASRFQHAIKLVPESGEPQRYLAMVLEKQGDAQAALAAYRKAVELNPADLSAKAGVERLAAAGRSSPSPSGATTTAVDEPSLMADLEGDIRQAKYKEVEPRLAEYVKEHPRSSWGWYALGYSQFAQQKIGDSIASLAKSLELDVTNAEAHKILGRNLMIIGRFDAAQVEFEQALRYKPDSAESAYNLGKLFSIQDNWEPARKQFEAALRIDPAYLEAIDALGFALEALGDDAGALEAYQKAIALNNERKGTFVSPLVNMSAYYNRTGDAAKALEYANQAIELDSRADRAWFQKGRAYERQGQAARGGRGAEPGDLIEPAVIFLLLRPRRSLQAAGADGREPEGAGDVQAPRARSQRARGKAARRQDHTRPVAMSAAHDRGDRQVPSRRRFLSFMAGCLGASPTFLVSPRSPGWSERLTQGDRRPQGR